MSTPNIIISYLPSKKISGYLLSGILAVSGIFLGLVPEISPSNSIKLSSLAYAKNYTEAEVENFAKAAYAVELLRQRAYQEIKKIDQSPPPIICNQSSNWDNLPSNIKKIAIRYCEQFTKIVNDHNLSSTRFNDLLALYKQEGDFYRDVQNYLMRMQKK